MQRILITGGAGFIGANFVHYWLEHHPGDRVVNLDALTYAGNPENLSAVSDHSSYRFVHGTIEDQERVETLLEEEAIDTIVNFAAESHVDRSILGPRPFVRTNIEGTFALLEAARRVWGDDTDGRRFVHVSTDEVYGSLAPEDAPFTEDSPYAPNSPYAASKAASDHLVRAYHRTYDLSTVITNCSNNYGPYQFPEKLIPLVILNALEGRSIPVYGDGAQIRDWLFVEDHCRGIEAALERGAPGETYLIGGRNEQRNLDLVHLICDRLDALAPGSYSYRDLITFVTDRPGHDRRYALDPGKIERSLGWSPAHDFPGGIDRTVRWYLDHRDWCDRVRSGEYREYYQRQYGAG